jgi:hypothetical protein
LDPSRKLIKKLGFKGGSLDFAGYMCGFANNKPDDVTGMMGIGFGESSPLAGLIEAIYSRW